MQAALTSSETSRLSSSPEAREFAHADEGDVHQGDRLVVAAELFAGGRVGLPGALDGPVPSSKVTSSIFVRNVVWRQWSDQ